MSSKQKGLETTTVIPKHSKKSSRGTTPDVTKRTNVFHFHNDDTMPAEHIELPHDPHQFELPDTRIESMLMDWDVLLVVEHCCNCAHHAASLRHDSDKYSGTANGMLGHLANAVCEAQFRVRCGLLRLNITSEAKIGAFEIFVLFRNRNGQVFRKKLFSKLESTLWPSKKSVEKNLMEFLVSMRVLKFSTPTPDFAYWESDDSLIAPYPVGYGPWLLTTVADPTWEYPIHVPIESQGGKAHHHSKGAAVPLPLPPKQLQIFWAFDSREAEPFRPVPGQYVRVSKTISQRGYRERQSLLATFLRYCDEIPLDDEGEFCQVQIKYTEEVVTVRLSLLVDCLKYSLQGPYPGAASFPEELLLVLLFCRSRRENTLLETGTDDTLSTDDGLSSHRSLEQKVKSPIPTTITTARISSPRLLPKASARGSPPKPGLPSTPAAASPPSAVKVSALRAQDNDSKFLDWSAQCSQDVVSLDQLFLCRKSLFLQLREVVCEVEKIIFPHLAMSSTESRAVWHPVTGHIVDLQYSYSEEVLDWMMSPEIQLLIGNSLSSNNGDGDQGLTVNIRELEHIAGRVFCSKLDSLTAANPAAPHYMLPLQLFLLRHCLKHELQVVLSQNPLNRQRYAMKRVCMEAPAQFANWAIKLIRSSLNELCRVLAGYGKGGDAFDVLHQIVRMLDQRRVGYLDFSDIRLLLIMFFPEFAVDDRIVTIVFDSIELCGSGNISVDTLRRFLLCRNDFSVEVGNLRPILSAHLQTIVDAEQPETTPETTVPASDISGTCRLSELFSDTLLRIAYMKFNATSHLEKGWEHNSRSCPPTDVLGQFLVHFGAESVMSEESMLLLVWSFCVHVSDNFEEDIDRTKLVNWFDFLTWILRYNLPATDRDTDATLYAKIVHQLLTRAVHLLHNDQSIKLVEAVTLLWDEPTEITYGCRLSATQLNARLSHHVAPGTDDEIRGEFRYFPGLEELLDAGHHTLRVSFVPLDATRFPLLEKTVPLTVQKVQPQILWSSDLGTIEVGDELSDSQLNATCINPIDSTTLAGSFFYSRSFGFTFAKTGNYDVEVRFIPDSWNFAQTMTTSKIKVVPRTTVTATTKLEPTIIWDDSKNPPLKVGEELSHVHLHATIAEEGLLGQFFYSKPYDYVFSKPGIYDVTATFVPQEPYDWKYKQVSKTIPIRVIRKDPLKTLVIWETPEPIVYGTLLNSIQLNALCVDPNSPDEIPGTYKYSHQDGSLLEPGEYTIELNFAPEDPTAYTPGYAFVTLVVERIAPILEWEPFDGPFYIEEPLNDRILNARCVNGIEGHFNYTRQLGHVYSKPGQYEITVTFMPQDLIYYSIATSVYTLTVLRPITLGHIEWNSPAEIPFGTPLSDTQLNAVFVLDATGEKLDGTFNYTPEHWAVLEGGVQILSVEFAPLDTCELDLKYDHRKSVLITIGKISPILKWVDNLGKIEMGVELTDSLLNAKAFAPQTLDRDKAKSLDGSFFYSKGIGYAFTRAGKHEIIATFLPSEAISKNYKQASCTATIEVISAVSDMELVWPYPENIEFGDPLTSVQLNAMVVDRSTGDYVDGEFKYCPGLGHYFESGRQNINVEFRPHTRPDHVIFRAVEIIVNKKMPTLIWPDPVPEPIFVGEQLSDVQLNAYCASSFELSGTISYSHGLGQSFSSPGTYEIIATFNSSTPNYYQAVKIVKLKVVPKIQEVHSTLNFSTPPSIYYGTVLADDHLHALCRDTHSLQLVDGVYRFDPPHGTLLPAGVHELSVEFVPVDASMYSVLIKTTNIIVHKAEPTILWEAEEDSVFVGQELTADVLNARVEEEIYGHFFYSRSIGFAFMKPGSYEITVTFVPGDEDSKNFKQVSKTVEYYVRMPDPIHLEIEWENPANIEYGTPLTHTQLCAKCVSGDDETRQSNREKVDIAGNFQYFPHLGQVLTAGLHELTVLFTFNNPIKYGHSISKSVYITVEKICPQIIWEEPTAPIVVGQPLTKEAHLTAYCVDNISGQFLYTPPPDTIITEAGYHILSAIFFPNEPFAQNYRQCSTTVHILAIDSEQPHLSVSAEIVWDTPVAISFGTRLTTAQLNARCIDREFGTEVDGRFEYSPNFGDVLGEGSHTLKVLFFPDHKRKYGEVYSHEIQLEVFDPIKLQPEASPGSGSKYTTGLRGLVKSAGEIVDPQPLFSSRTLVFHRIIIDGRVLKRAKFGDVIVRLRFDGEEWAPVEMYKFDKVDSVINFHFESKSIAFSASDFLTKQMTLSIKGRSLLKGNRIEFSAGAGIPLKQLMDVSDGPFHITLFAYPKLYLTDVRTVVADDDVNSKCKLRISIVAHAYEPTFLAENEIERPLPTPTFDSNPNAKASRNAASSRPRPQSANAAHRSSGGRASYGVSPFSMLTSFGATETSEYGFGKSTGLPAKQLFHSPAAPTLPMAQSGSLSPQMQQYRDLLTGASPKSPSTSPPSARGRRPRPQSAPQRAKRNAGSNQRPLVPVVLTASAAVAAMRDAEQRIQEDTVGRWPEAAQGRSDLKLASARPLPGNRPNSAGARPLSSSAGRQAAINMTKEGLELFPEAQEETIDDDLGSMF